MTRKGPAPTPYLWRGKTYLGQSAVARAAGVHQSTIHYHLTRHGHLDYLGIGTGRHQNHRPPSRPIRVGRREWPSIAALARHLDKPPRILYRWLRDNRHERLLKELILADEKTRQRDRPAEKPRRKAA